MKQTVMRIRNNNGNCMTSGYPCETCPFSKENNGLGKDCIEIGVRTKPLRYMLECDKDRKLVHNVCLFLDGIIAFVDGVLTFGIEVPEKVYVRSLLPDDIAEIGLTKEEQDLLSHVQSEYSLPIGDSRKLLQALDDHLSNTPVTGWTNSHKGNAKVNLRSGCNSSSNFIAQTSYGVFQAGLRKDGKLRVFHSILSKVANFYSIEVCELYNPMIG